MWLWFGFVLSAGLAGLAWWRSAARSGTFYEAEFYGMGRTGHRRYAIGFTVAAAVFLAQALSPKAWWPEAFLALLVLTGILYAAGFVRGAMGEDE